MLRVLIIEDSQEDYDLLLYQLRKLETPIESLRVSREPEMRAALEAPVPWDLVLADWVLPNFSAPDALRVLLESPHPNVPCIVVSGVVGEETAVLAMQLGARDFVRKDRLERLASVVEREMLFLRTSVNVE